MKDMKLKTLLPVGKIEPRKPVTEMLGVEILDKQKAVELSIDDATLHVHPGAGVKDLNALAQLVSALSLNKVFTSAMYEAVTKRKVTEIQMSITRDGVKFSSRR